MFEQLNPDWPVVRSFAGKTLRRVAMPLGGIGTGCVSLGGRGNLCEWSLMNRPTLEMPHADGSYFLLWTKPAGGKAETRCLEGAIDTLHYHGPSGVTVRDAGLPRMKEAVCDTAYPLGQVRLQDPSVPIKVRIEAFNPLIPGDAARSGIPLAVMRFVLINPTNRPVDAAISGTLTNWIGHIDTLLPHKPNVNKLRQTKDVRGVVLQSPGTHPDCEWFGSLALATTARTGVTMMRSTGSKRWGGSRVRYWDMFSANGRLDDLPKGGETNPIAAVAVRTRIPARGSRAITYLISWHFPNQVTWSPKPKEGKPAAAACCSGGECCPSANDLVGEPIDPADRLTMWYTTQYRDAWDVIKKTAPQLPTLEKDTVRYVRAVADSDLPTPVKDAALANTSTLRTQTCFRTDDGHFYGWEGHTDTRGCCNGTCTHVWNYEQTTGFLFGEMARSMRTVEFGHATNDAGLMSFRTFLPLSRAQEMGRAAVDGQMGAIVRLYREWKHSGDDALLCELYPAAKRAMSFAWIKGGWDADRDGVLEGCQHNTYDVEFFGPNPLCTSLYLAGLRASEAMATYLGDDAFAATCRDLHERGGRGMDERMFNGDFYQQHVRSMKPSQISPGLRLNMGAPDLKNPAFQVGDGCLIDQLLGQYVAHIADLGHICDRRNIRKALRAILKHNTRNGFHDHFNFLRSYALGDDAGVLMCAYPIGGRPELPFPYATEVWSGCEYALAALLAYEGMTAQATRVVADARDRHDGYKRNPFDEMECGYHYARPMSAWAVIVAMTGFHYDGVAGRMRFGKPAKPVTWFWSNGDAWGVVKIKARRAELTVMHGEVKLTELAVDGVGSAPVARRAPVRAGQGVRVSLKS